MTPSNIVKVILQQAPSVVGASPTVDWGLNISKMPTTPIRSIAIFDTGGFNPNPALLLDFKTVQVQVRGNANDNALTYEKAQGIKDRLLGAPSQDMPGAAPQDRMVSLTMIGDITFAGRDENDYPIYTINFRLITEPATNALTQRIAV